MSSLMTALGIDRMSPDERLQLVQEIWDSIAGEAEGSAGRAGMRTRLGRCFALPE